MNSSEPLYGLTVAAAFGLVLALATSVEGQVGGASQGPVTDGGWGGEGSQDMAHLGRSVAAAGDINGDGFQDVIVGAPGAGEDGEGMVFVHHGSAQGLGPAVWSAQGEQAGAEFGHAAASAGDVNADGFDDIIVGAWLYDDRGTDDGKVFVWYGSAAGLGPSGTPGNADWSAGIGRDGAKFGNTVASAGDVNGDGLDDIIVGGFHYSSSTSVREGRAYVWYGGSVGLGDDGTETNADWSAEGGLGGAWFGASVTAADVNRDGLMDVIIGAPGYADASTAPSGRAFLFLGSAGGLSGASSWTGQGGEGFGHAVSRAGDLTGDGIDDVIIGAPLHSAGENQEGAVYAFSGGTRTGLSALPIWSLESNLAGARLGEAVAGAGDVNGDGLDDVLTGAPGYPFSGAGDLGRVDLYLGTATGLPVVPSWSDKGPGNGSLFGAAIGAFVNVDGDAFSDVLVGAPEGGDGQQGLAWIFPGDGGFGEPPDLESITLIPAEVDAGQNSVGRIQLSKNAPLGGTPVDVSSTDGTVAAVPANVLVPEGENLWDFAVDTFPVAQETVVEISVSFNGQSVAAMLTVNPDPPLFFDDPPHTLLIGAFTLSVQSYSQKEWDFDNGVMINTDGEAELTLTCDGNNDTVGIPFNNLTIEPVVQGVGKVIAGSVTYPGTPPPPLELELAGFTLLVDSLTLSPTSAEAASRLRFPASIVDVSSDECRPAEIDLGVVPFNPQCRIFQEYLGLAFGPWEVGDTGMEISGTGVFVDLSIAEKAPSPPYPFLPLAWRGVILREGETAPDMGVVISNTGYLRAEYEFENGLVSSNGLAAQFQLAHPFIFNTLQPLGYRIDFTEATLDMSGNLVVSGELRNGELRLPERAVVKEDTLPVRVSFDVLTVQGDMDLEGVLDVKDEIFWGELTNSVPGERIRTFSYKPSMMSGRFYISAAYKPEYYPLDGSGDFKLPVLGPGNVFGHLESQNIQGLTIVQLDSTAFFQIYSEDQPDGEVAAPPDLPPAIKGIAIAAPFINVASEGVHGQVSVFQLENSSDRELGPTYRSDYEGGDLPPPSTEKAPFDATFAGMDTPDGFYQLFFRFVDSAVYHSDGNGHVSLASPVGADLDFERMNITSTAQIPAAKIVIDFQNPAQLAYWKLELGQKLGASEAGVMHVRSGRIFLTNATLGEPRHFEKPFCLIWATIRANGQIGDLVFNYDSSGQKFDGFGFAPSLLALSDFDPTSEKKDRFLQVAGTTHFDFFGAYYLDLRDHIHENADPINGGRDIFLEDDGLNGALPSEQEISGEWSGTFGLMAFTISYDKGDYDGFVGPGEMGLLYIGDELESSINMSRERICMSVHDGVDDGFEDLSLPPIASFTVLGRTTGCGCIEDGVLKRVHLQSEQENAGNVTAVVRSAEYLSIEMDLTPSTTALDLHGSMFLNMGPGVTDIEVVGGAGFLVDIDEEFVEGHVDGRFDAASFLNIAGGLNAEGQLSWHLGNVGEEGGYHSMQGRVAVGIVAPMSAMGTGIEGGFYTGLNAPSSEAWVLKNTDPRFVDFNLPSRLTGAYGYARYSKSLNLYVLSGGYEIYSGLGFFLDETIPEVIGQMRAHIWGEVLGGLLSASAWAQLLLQANPLDPVFKGSVGLEVCALFVVCNDINLQLEVDKNGFDIDD